MQERWLNKMAHGGYRLVRTGKLLYEFETCQAGEFAYCAEFIGHMAGERAEEYCGFLKDAGYRVFYKNINLNYSLGKIRFRPWADKGGILQDIAETLFVYGTSVFRGGHFDAGLVMGGFRGSVSDTGNSVSGGGDSNAETGQNRGMVKGRRRNDENEE